MQYNIIIGRDEEEKKRFGEKAAIFLGKHYVRMGQTTSLANNVLLDVARAHVILVAGKRGSGKCLIGDTLIQLNDGSLVEIEKLKDDNRMVVSLNERLKIDEGKKTEFFEREVDKILKLKLRSGKEIKLTPEHPLFTIKGWKEASSLTIGSRIATPRVIPIFGKDDLEDHKIKLLAYMIAEGHTKRALSFSNYDSDILEDFKEALNRLDNRYMLTRLRKGYFRITMPSWKGGIKNPNIFKGHNGRFKKGLKIERVKSPFRLFLENYNISYKKSAQKEIPVEITRLPREKLSLFLNRLFSCDGSIYYMKRDEWEISYSSSSEKLIRTIQNLLLRFGILSKLRNKKMKLNGRIFLTFELVINGENVVKFIDNIGFYGKKNEKQKLALEHFKNKKRNPNVDTIPIEIWSLYKPDNWARIGRGFNYKYPKAMRERMFYAPSRQTLLQISILDNNESIKTIAESDIFWDEIVGIDLIEEKTKVYDICVPEYHNFIANDIIVHNSTTLGVIAEEMSDLPKEISKNLAVVIIDTLGIFWTMKFPNKRQEHLLRNWNIKSRGFDAKIYVPSGYYHDYKKRHIPADYSFTIKTNELNSSDWCNVFGIELNSSMGVVIDRALRRLNGSYSINEIIKTIGKDKKAEKKDKDALENRLLAANEWGIFSEKGSEIKDLIKNGQVTILDISQYTNVAGNWGIKGLIIGIISRKLLAERVSERKEEEMHSIRETTRLLVDEESEKPSNMIWMMIDEAHEFLPRHGNNPARDALIQLLREGRQPGISMVLATQQPGEIARDVMTQADIVISHRLTSKTDMEALNSIMQTYLLADIQKYMNQLPNIKGSAIILDDNSERIYPMGVRPRQSWHGGEAPSALVVRKKLFEGLNI